MSYLSILSFCSILIGCFVGGKRKIGLIKNVGNVIFRRYQCRKSKIFLVSNIFTSPKNFQGNNNVVWVIEWILGDSKGPLKSDLVFIKIGENFTSLTKYFVSLYTAYIYNDNYPIFSPTFLLSTLFICVVLIFLSINNKEIECLKRKHCITVWIPIQINPLHTNTHTPISFNENVFFLT